MRYHILLLAHTGMVEHTAACTRMDRVVREERQFLFWVSPYCPPLFQRRNRFAVFVGAWAGGLLVAYSALPYKTPWICQHASAYEPCRWPPGAETLGCQRELLRGTFVRPALALCFLRAGISFYQACNSILFTMTTIVTSILRPDPPWLFGLDCALDEIAGRAEETNPIASLQHNIGRCRGTWRLQKMSLLRSRHTD